MFWKRERVRAARASSRSLMIETNSFGRSCRACAQRYNASGQRKQISDTMVHLPKDQFVLFLCFAAFRNIAGDF